jgi:hypothetical protein
VEVEEKELYQLVKKTEALQMQSAPQLFVMKTGQIELIFYSYDIPRVIVLL